jgi:hypothetical protein
MATCRVIATRATIEPENWVARFDEPNTIECTADDAYVAALMLMVTAKREFVQETCRLVRESENRIVMEFSDEMPVIPRRAPPEMLPWHPDVDAMTAPPKPGFMLPVAVTLAVLLGSYVGAYCWMAEPFPPSAFPGERYTANVAGYPLKWMGTLFAPIHWLDRRIRPHVWEPK